MARFVLGFSDMSKFKFYAAALAMLVLPLAACDKQKDEQAEHAHGDGHDPSHAHASAQGATEGDTRVVAVNAGDDGFKPSRIEVKQGQATTLRFTRTSDKTCADKVVFPEIKLEKSLPLNQPVDVVVPTEKSRTLAFQCGMGMYKSSLVIH